MHIFEVFQIIASLDLVLFLIIGDLGTFDIGAFHFGDLVFLLQSLT